jgi:hypothetical protein
MTVRKKLIEVALPLEAINAASAREKSIRHGHPSTLHLWWARRPLAACRAVLFGQLVDDPSSWPERFKGEEAQGAERKRLHDFIAELVKWESSNDERVLNQARWYIARSIAWSRGEEPPDAPEAVRSYLLEHAPPVYDPFCGGGSIPLEAQRLGHACLRLRPQSGGVDDQQGAGRVPTQVRGFAAGQSRVAQEAGEWRRMERQGRTGPGRGCTLVWPLDARRGREADRSSLSQGTDHA